MASDVQKINEFAYGLSKKSKTTLSRIASVFLLPIDAITSYDPGFFNILDRLHGVVFGWTKMFRPALDSIKVKTWIVNFIISILLLLGITQLTAFIYYVDCMTETNSSDGFAVAGIIFTCLTTTFFLIYYISKNMVSRWYDVYCKSMLDNRAGIANIEFNTTASIVIFFIFTILYVQKHGFDAHLFNGSRAELDYQFMATNLAVTSFLNMVVVFYYLNLFTVHGETHILYQRDHKKHNIDYISAVLSTIS